ESVLPEGALAWASDVAHGPESIAPLLRSLLQDVAIFPDLQTAVRYREDAPDRAVAAVSGEFISEDGIVFGGSSAAQSESLLARKGRITALTNDCAAIRTE